MTGETPHAWSGGFDEPTWAALCAALTALRRGRPFTSHDDHALLAAADEVGVRSLVGAALSLPLDDDALAHAARARATLTLVHDAFSRAAIEHVFWKGAFADATLWGGRGIRVGDDVDVLVRADAFEQARLTLASLGYVPNETGGQRATASVAKAWCFHPLSAATVPVDLHRRPLNAPPFSSRSEDVFAHARDWQTPHGPVPGARPEDAVPWIAGNLAGGRFQGLLRLAADAACLWERVLDAEAVISVARAWRAESATFGLLRLLEARFEVAVPARVLDALRPAAPVARLIEGAFGAVGAPTLPATQAEAVLLMDWPLAGRAGWLAEKVGNKLALAAGNRAAELLHKIRSHPAAALGNVRRPRRSPVPLSVSSKVQVPAEVLLQEVDGESVLLDLRSEKYFGLDESGTTLFQALKDTGTIKGAIDAGLAAFEVERKELTADVLELVQALAAEGLIVVED